MVATTAATAASRPTTVRTAASSGTQLSAWLGRAARCDTGRDRTALCPVAWAADEARLEVGPDPAGPPAWDRPDAAGAVDSVVAVGGPPCDPAVVPVVSAVCELDGGADVDADGDRLGVPKTLCHNGSSGLLDAVFRAGGSGAVAASAAVAKARLIADAPAQADASRQARATRRRLRARVGAGMAPRLGSSDSLCQRPAGRFVTPARACGGSAGAQQPVEHPGAERQCVERHTLIDAVEHGREVEVGR